MSLIRTILALTVGLAVAMLPAAGAFASAEETASTIEMSAMQPMQDCTDDKGQPQGNAADRCALMAICAGGCFNFSGGLMETLVSPPAQSSVTARVYWSIRSRAGAAPFRPPRF